VEAVHLTASVGSGDSARKGLFLPFLAALLGCVLASGSAASQPAATGQLECKVTENGGPASGTVTLLREGQEAYRGNCNQAAAVPPGSYTAVIGLDGVLDGPEKRSEVSVKAGGKVSVAADFATGIIEVQIESKGRQAAGMAVISRDGRQIGTLGSGVSAHLSAGTYQVVARYRTQKKAFGSVSVQAGKKEVLKASFE
jgi:hypothetical protein